MKTITELTDDELITELEAARVYANYAAAADHGAWSAATYEAELRQEMRNRGLAF